MNPFYPAINDPRIARAQEEVRRVRSKATDSDFRAARIEGRVDRLAMVCAALWDLVKEHTELTEEDLFQRVEDIDLRDGVLVLGEDGPVGTRADWRQAPEIPWFPDRQHPARRGSSPVLQVPVTLEWDRPVPGWLRHALDRWPDEGAAGRLRDQIARPRRLDPLALDLPTLQAMAQRTVARGIPCINLPLRSRELSPGCSERCPEVEDVERTFTQLEGFLRFAVETLQLTPRGLTAFADAYLSADPSD